VNSDVRLLGSYILYLQPLKAAELLFHATRVADRTSLDLILLLKVTTRVRHTAPSCLLLPRCDLLIKPGPVSPTVDAKLKTKYEGLNTPPGRAKVRCVTVSILLVSWSEKSARTLKCCVARG
jgi:hypothetical protein